MSASAISKVMSQSQQQQCKALAEKACKFLSGSTDPFHAVHHSVERLKSAGFEGLSSSAPLTNKIRPGGKYYYTVENSTLVAFSVGDKYQTGGGFHMIGGHTDSPNLKLKPRSKKEAANAGCKLLAVECYGGGLWHTWFDRDLGVSGRVLVKTKEGGFQQRLVQITDPIARISTLCIHLQSAEERKGFSVNKESHTAPIVATTTNSIASPANEEAKKTLEDGAEAQVNSMTAWQEGHEPLLMQMIASKLDVPVEDIVDFELNLFDTQAAALGGIGHEFLYSARLDNLATVFCAVEALADFDAKDSADISLVVAFDHEEVGSTSAQGAGSPVMDNAVKRISAALQGGEIDPDQHLAAIRKSFILSIDQAHAIHPNYASKHEINHAPKLNGGVVIKTNSNQRYATNGITGFMVRELGRRANIPIQEFVVRNDCPCGSTIGPTISANTGIRTVDAGMPQLSMHSCREMMGIADLSYGLGLFQTFFNEFRDVDNKLSKDIQPCNILK